ncbi:hypothetical protein BaRGS_00038136, partial [Batillaria attramentaria]
APQTRRASKSVRKACASRVTEDDQAVIACTLHTPPLRLWGSLGLFVINWQLTSAVWSKPRRRGEEAR